MKRLLYSLMIMAWCVSCARMKPLIKEAEEITERKEITIVFTNSSMGAFEPQGCGCRRLGGLVRRAHFIRNVRQASPSALVFDSGNVLFSRNDFSKNEEKTKASYMLSALNDMGVDVLNIGAQDCKMGADFLTVKRDKLSISFLSANLRNFNTKDLAFAPYVTKTIDDMKIGIFGLTDGFGKTLTMKGRDISIDNPLTSAQQTVKALQEHGCSLILLLSQLSLSENRRLAQDVPGISFILGTSSDALLKNPEIVGKTAILSPGTHGRYAAVLKIIFEYDSAPFYNLKSKETVEEKIRELKEKENNPERSVAIEEVVLKRVVLQEKLKAFEGKNAYGYNLIALDGKVKEDPNVKLILEKYKEQSTRHTLSSYKENVPTINLTALPEEKRLKALRLLNEISCRDGSIADSAAKDLFCRSLAHLIVENVKKGESEGKIRFGLLYEKGKMKNSLDKNMLLQ